MWGVAQRDSVGQCDSVGGAGGAGLHLVDAGRGAGRSGGLVVCAGGQVDRRTDSTAGRHSADSTTAGQGRTV